MGTPLVSVLMSVYNGERYLAQAIESVLGQTFREWELIVVDDGSTDGSRALLEEYARGDDRIKIIRNDENEGLPRALNKAAAIASGRYLARQDADDISRPERLQRQVDVLEANPDVTALGTMGRYINRDGDMLDPIVVRGRSIGEHVLRQNSIFPHGSLLMRAGLFRDVDGYDERFWFSQDMELYSRLVVRGHVLAALDEPLYLFRIGETGPNSFKGAMQGRFAKCMYAMHFEGKSADAELDALALELAANRTVRKASKSTAPSSDYWLGCAYRAALGKRLGPMAKCVGKAGRITWRTIPVILYYLAARWPKSVHSGDGVFKFDR